MDIGNTKVKISTPNKEVEFTLWDYFAWLEKNHPTKVKIYRDDEIPTLSCYKDSGAKMDVTDIYVGRKEESDDL